MRRLVAVLLLALGLTPGANAQDKNMMRFVAQSFFECAAFYQAVIATGILPKGRTKAQTAALLERATDVAITFSMASEDKPVRDNAKYAATTKKSISDQAARLARDYRADPAKSARLVQLRFRSCDDVMKSVRN